MNRIEEDEKNRIIIFVKFWLNFIVYFITATFVYAGGWIGNVTCLLSTGLLAASPWGWPSCFYVWGSITIVSSLLFFFIGYESPAEHPNIPQDEKQYIESSLGMIETEEVRIFDIFEIYIIAYIFNDIYIFLEIIDSLDQNT